MNAQGTLNEKNDRYLDSLEAHLQQLGTQAERTYDILFDEKAVKGWVDALDGALGIFNNFIKGIGGGTTAFTYFGSLVAGIFNKQIAQAIQGVSAEISRFKANLGAVAEKQKVIDQIKSGLQVAWAGQGQNLGNTALTAQAEAAQKTLAVQRGLTAEQQKQAVQIQKQIGLQTQKTENLKQQLAEEQKQNQKARESLGLDQTKKSLDEQELKNLQKQSQYSEEKYQSNLKILSIFTQTQSALSEAEDTDAAREAIAEKFETHQEQIYQAYVKSGGEVKKWDQYWEKIVKEIKQGENSLDIFAEIQDLIRANTDKHKNIVQQIKVLLDNNKKKTQQQLHQSEKVTQEYKEQNNVLAEQGRKTLNLQTLVRGFSAAGMALSSWAGAAKTFGDQMATAQQKVNAITSSIQGTISGVGTLFGPIGMGVSTLINGAISLIEQVPQFGDWLEDHFKSAQQRIDELNASISKVNQNDRTKNAQISNLEGLVEEYEKLSEKAGDYGVNLDNLTQQEQDRYHQITNSFAEYNSAVIAGYDDQGNAIVRGQDALKDTIEVLKQAKLQADKAALGDKNKFLEGISTKHTKANEDRQNALGDAQEKAEFDFVNAFAKGSGDLSVIRGDLSTFTGDFLLGLDNQLSGLTSEQRSKFFKDAFNESQDEFNESYQEFVDNIVTAVNNGDNELLLKALEQGSKYRKSLRDKVGDQTLLSQYDVLFSYLPSDGEYQDYLDKLKKVKDEKDELNKQIADQTYSSEDANALITGLQVYDNETWSTIESKLKQMGIGTSGFIKKLTDYITSQKVSEIDINDLYTQIQGQAESYAQILTNYEDSIKTAEQDAVEDAKTIFKKKDQSAKGLHQDIYNSIIENFLNNEDMQDLLAEAKDNSKYKDFLESLIGSVYNLEDIKIVFDEDGKAYITELQTQKDKINTEISKVLFSNDKITGAGGLHDNEILNEHLQGLKINDDTLLAVKNALSDPALTFSNLHEAIDWIDDFIQQSDRQMDVKPIIEKFDKISEVIKKLHSDEKLNWKQEDTLAQALGLTPEQLTQLDSNADWLKTIVNKIYTTLNPENAEESATRKQAFVDLFPTLQDLDKAFKESQDIKDGWGMTAEQYEDAWNQVYQNELQQLNINEQALKDYADAKGLAFGTRGEKKAALEAYQNAQTYNELSQALKNAKDKMDDFYGSAENVADDFELNSQLTNILSLLRDLGAEDISLQWLIDNFDALEAAAQGDIEAFKELLAKKDELQKLGSPTADRYQEGKTNIDNLEGASQSLTDKTALSQDQSQALAGLLLVDKQLSAIAEDQGINSQAFLEALNATIEAKKQELEITKQQALYVNRARQQEIQKDLKTQENADKQKSLQNDLIELKQKELELQQQIGDTEAPKFDADINVQELENLSDTIQQIAPQSEELADGLAKNEDAADDLAQAILRFDDACKDVSENYEDWMAALNSGSIQEQAQAMDGLRDAYADLLDLDGSALSNDFLTNIENLDLMKAAIDGDTDAYDELLSRAGQDILIQVGIDPTQFYSDRDAIWAAAAELTGTDFGNIEIGADLKDEGFFDELEHIINATGMTAQQATDYLASMGVDAEVIEQKTDGTETQQITGWHAVPDTTKVPYDYTYLDGEDLKRYRGYQTYSGVRFEPDTETVTNTKENTAFGLKVTSAHKTSGGNFKFSQAKNGGGSKGVSRRSGGGSGGKGRSGGNGRGGNRGGGSGKAKEPDTSQKDPKKSMKDTRDIYHDINIELKQINKQLDRVQKKQDRLYGKQLLDNLKEQSKILDQHKAKLEEKHELQKQDLASQQQTLKNLGVAFDKYGNISNYMDILGNIIV